jgi:hypothetical protein
MMEPELRAKTRALMASGALPPMLPAFEKIEPGQGPSVTKIEIATQAQEHCLVCHELGPQVSYNVPGWEGRPPARRLRCAVAAGAPGAVAYPRELGAD